MNFLVSALVLAWPPLAFSTELEVSRVCKVTHLPTVTLKYRAHASNLSQIRKETLTGSPLAGYLKALYSKKEIPSSESEQLRLANEGNRQTLPDSDLKEKFLRFSDPSERIKYPADYVNTVISAAKSTSRRIATRIDEYLKLQSPIVEKSIIKSASKDQTGFYGAVYGAEPGLSEDRFIRQIVLSNNASEPIPYLIPLLLHELVHAESYQTFLELDPDKNQFWEFRIVDEAKAFDAQMIAYLELAKSNPELFCNWLYVTWSYGNLIVPLSWTMASMEKEMRSGELLDTYAQTGRFEGKAFMLGKDKKLRTDLRAKIAQLHLKFVR